MLEALLEMVKKQCFKWVLIYIHKNVQVHFKNQYRSVKSLHVDNVKSLIIMINIINVALKKEYVCNKTDLHVVIIPW